MKTETYTLPAFWASALINGDYSGLSVCDVLSVDLWLNTHPELGACLSCSEEAEFIHWHIDSPEVLPCDCLDFLFPVTESTT